MRHKEAELTRAVLTYAAESLHDGDWAALRDMGFGEDELHALQELTLVEVALLSHRLKGHILRVRLDRAAFRQLLAQVQRDVDRDRLKRELVRREAPAELMEALYGMGSREYTGLRRAIRLTRGPGRPPEPDEITVQKVWFTWRDQFQARDPEELEPQDWLTLSETTGRDLRAIYRVLQDSPAPRSPQPADADAAPVHRQSHPVSG